MRGSIIIDGIDIDNFGVFILKGGDNDFLSFPERKEPAQYNWHESDGLDIDLTEVYFKEKKVDVDFYIRASSGPEFKNRLTDFYKLLKSPGYRSIYSREFDRTFSLRYISSSEYTHSGGLNKSGNKWAKFRIRFSMDNPLQLFTKPGILVPVSDLETIPSYVKINGYDLSLFGITVNQCYDTILALPSIKQPLTRSFETSNGLQVYPTEKNSFESRQILIDCTMRANTRDSFYHNYEALFNNLIKPRAVRLSSYMGENDCYYSSMQGFEKLQPFKNGVLVKFTLKLTTLK